MATTQLQKLSPMHYQLIDWLIVHKAQKGWAEKCCEHFGISRSWLSIVMNSDVFKELYEQRQQNHNRQITEQIAAQTADVAVAALTRLRAILEDDEVDDRLVLDTANSALKNLGLAPRAGAAPSLIKESEITRESVREISPGVLERARTTYKRITHGEEALPAPSSG